MPAQAPSEALPEAVILAAGVGRRLGDGIDRPKVMLEFGGESLLARHLHSLQAAGLRRVSIVIGYAADHIRAAVAASTTMLEVVLIENPDYREGSVVSLWMARAVLRRGCPVVLMDGDVLYDDRLMARLIAGAAPNVLLLDREIEPGDEPVKLCIREGRIVDFRKRPTEAYDWHGESVGFFRFAPDAAAELANRAERYVENDRRGMEYEEPVRDMMMASAAGRFGFEDISGLPWTEIDFPEDVAKAAALVPALAS